MSMSDTIADMLTRIRNAQAGRLLNVILPYSKIKNDILKVLKAEGYINEFQVTLNTKKSFLQIELKYTPNGKPAISEIHRVSKPGKRIYSPINKLKGYYNNMGIQIISTSKGVISDREAYSYRVGGEIICKVF